MLSAISSFCAAIALASAPQIQGDYVEARTADIYTGPCFSNAEVFITGNRGVMAWKIRSGRFAGQDLSGLAVAAAIEGTTTFSKDKPELARTVLIVDETASPEQRKALIALAKELGGDRFKNVAEVKVSRIQMMVEEMPEHESSADSTSHHGMPQAPQATFWAPGIAEILTRPFVADDHSCGNEVVEYPPLSKGVTALPAYTVKHTFKGKALNATWDDPNCRSSFVGHFAY